MPAPLEHELIDLFEQEGEDTAVVEGSGVKVTPDNRWSFVLNQLMSPRERADLTATPDTLIPELSQHFGRVPNPFNSYSSVTQTPLCRTRGAISQTDVTRYAKFGATCSAWRVHDAYAEDIANRLPEEDDKGVVSEVESEHSSDEKETDVVEAGETEDLALSLGVCRIMERVVNQNTHAGVIMDYKHYEDPSDDYKETEGSLLPLWKLKYAPAKGLAVTEVHWSSAHDDLLLVTLGSLHFAESVSSQPGSGGGLVCLFSLCNPSFPEFLWSSGGSSVTSADLLGHLLCVGLRNGAVQVLSVSTASGKLEPLCRCLPVDYQHYDRVTAVRWHLPPRSVDSLPSPSADAEPTFFSVSSDGRMLRWRLMYGELRALQLIRVRCPSLRWALTSPSGGDDGILVGAGVSALEFQPDDPDIFAIGTDTGSLIVGRLGLACVAAATPNPPYVRAHAHSVLSLSWNRFCCSLLASAGGDSRLLVWQCDDKRGAAVRSAPTLLPQPLLVYELTDAVTAVAWSPWSSTVLAAASVDGFVHVFDLEQDRYQAVCKQLIIDPRRGNRLTRLAFSRGQQAAVLAVGDLRGVSHVLKLSPNLRRLSKEAKAADADKLVELEVAKMNRLLDLSLESKPERPVFASKSK